jgi:hypothetical protein
MRYSQQTTLQSFKADNSDGTSMPLSAIGPRCADFMMARLQINNSHEQAGYTTATIPTGRELLSVSACGRSPYTVLGGAWRNATLSSSSIYISSVVFNG